MPKDDQKKELSAKHQKFVDEYLTCWNATQAYRAVYPKANAHSARVLAANLLANVSIRAEISERAKKQGMEADEILARLADQARGTHRPFVKITSDGFVYFDFSNPEALEHLHLIKKIRTKRSRRMEGRGKGAQKWEDEWVEVELEDRQRALELLGKAQKIFIDRHELTGKDGAPLSRPAEGPFDMGLLLKYATNEELDILQRAREIIDRIQFENKSLTLPAAGNGSKPGRNGTS